MANPTFPGRLGTVAVDTVLVVISAGLLGSAFPGISIPIFSWIALVPLFLVIHRSNYAKSVSLSLLCGVLFYMFFMRWTAGVDEIGPNYFVLYMVFLALGFALFGLLAKYFQARFPGWDAFTFPSLWMAVEYLKSHLGFLSFQQGLLGYSQYKVAPVAGIAEFAGVYGVSFIIVAVNASLASLAWNSLSGEALSITTAKVFRITSCVMLGFAVFLIATIFIHGGTRKHDSGHVIEVALIQGNAVANEKTTSEKYLKDVLPTYLKLTLEAARVGAELVVWPSSSVPGVVPYDRKMTTTLARVAQTSGAYLLVGAAGYNKFNSRQAKSRTAANSAFLFSPKGGIAGKYDKIHLLPFSEYLPLRNFISWPSWIVPPGVPERFSGRELTLFQAGESHFGVQICFENMFPEQIRELVSKGADFIVAQTNDIYTKSESAQYQNLTFNVFRAIENQVPVIRSSTNGVSCFIEPDGRIAASVKDSSGKEVNIAGSVISKVYLQKGRSFYNRFGDLIPQVVIIAISVMALYGVFANPGKSGYF